MARRLHSPRQDQAEDLCSWKGGAEHLVDRAKVPAGGEDVVDDYRERGRRCGSGRKRGIGLPKTSCETISIGLRYAALGVDLGPTGPHMLR